MKLINAEWVEKQAVCIYTYGGARYVSLNTIKAAPAVDAVEVVRCKDCWRYDDDLCGYVHKNKHGMDFCGAGERKTE